MHEYSLCEEIVRIVDERNPEHKSVKTIYLKVGAMQQVVQESLDFFFEMMAKETHLANARIEIEEIPLGGICNACQKNIILDSPPFACQHCGSEDLKLETGFELKVDSFDTYEEQS